MCSWPSAINQPTTWAWVPFTVRQLTCGVVVYVSFKDMSGVTSVTTLFKFSCHSVFILSVGSRSILIWQKLCGFLCLFPPHQVYWSFGVMCKVLITPFNLFISPSPLHCAGKKRSKAWWVSPARGLLAWTTVLERRLTNS